MITMQIELNFKNSAIADFAVHITSLTILVGASTCVPYKEESLNWQLLAVSSVQSH